VDLAVRDLAPLGKLGLQVPDFLRVPADGLTHLHLGLWRRLLVLASRRNSKQRERKSQGQPVIPSIRHGLNSLGSGSSGDHSQATLFALRGRVAAKIGWTPV
jgi:hypothetical protein